jgi:type II secretory ATPase GspE/PulE/Tfp pilus assembly ATPase PilB-like protein
MEFTDVSIVRDESQKSVTDVSELLSLTNEEPIVRLTDHILNEGIRRRASDIFVEPGEQNMSIRYRIDGVLREGPGPPQSTHQGVVCRIKIMSTLNIAEHRLPQDGRFKIRSKNQTVDFRVSTIPTYLGEKVCLRILDPSQAKLDMDHLGFEKRDSDLLLKMASKPHGMILTCGPTGSGKTTTLYSIMNYLNTIERNLVTIEDPVEYAVPGINQVNTRADVNLTFASALRSILRQDPDVVLVGEIRDAETSDIAVKAALTGHLVLSTLHTNTAVGTITRMINLGVEPFLLTSTILLTGSQRLIRKVCTKCSTEYDPSDEIIRRFKLEGAKNIVLRRAHGCEECQQTGYLGRINIIELLPMTQSVKNLVISGAQEDKIKAAGRKDGMRTLRESAVERMKKGITTVDEVLRTTMPDE